ncbi:MAG: hypothetical protein FJ219_00440 [Ignavibacteria bacterium]|nr:hypothetical protein [Ignavibacteria bacterium]
MNQQTKPEHIDEQLISYLDGELPIEQEDSMFQSLASDEEDARGTMRELISMRNVIPHDIEAFTPPPAAKDAVFSQLGMTSNSTVKEQSSWKRALLPLAFLALGLAGGYGLGDRFSNNDEEIMQLMRKSSAKGAVAPLTSIGISLQVPTIVLQQAAPVKVIYRDRILNTASVTPMITLPPIAVNQQSNAPAVDEIQTMTTDSKPADQSPIASSEVSSQSNTNGNNIQDQVIKETERIQIGNTHAVYPQFWIQLRNMSTLQSPEFSGIREQLGIMDNSRVTFAWSLGEHFAVGLEAGREPFVLEYQGIKEDRPFVFNQYSPMLTGGLFLQGRTSALDYLGNSRFYAQAVAGGSEIGILGRFGLGIAYPISDAISLQLGLEQSYMQFQFQGNAFDSQKLDLLYGISITL